MVGGCEGEVGDGEKAGVEIFEGGGGGLVGDVGGVVFHLGDFPIFAEEGFVVSAEEDVALGVLMDGCNGG